MASNTEGVKCMGNNVINYVLQAHGAGFCYVIMIIVLAAVNSSKSNSFSSICLIFVDSIVKIKSRDSLYHSRFKMIVERHIDTRALDGLRGIAALHVMVGHFLETGCPAVEMTLFYLLSGYSLALAYGARRNEEGSFVRQTVWFYWNRFVRTAPSFYLSNIAAFLISFNTRTLLLRKVKFITTLTISNSWFKPYTEPYIPFNGPSWTISTMTMMYLVFPVLLPLLRKLSDASLAKSLVILYYVQLAPVWYMFHYDYTR